MGSLLVSFFFKAQTLTYPWKPIIKLDEILVKALKGALVVAASYSDSMLSSAWWNFSRFKECSQDVTKAH